MTSISLIIGSLLTQISVADEADAIRTYFNKSQQLTDSLKDSTIEATVKVTKDNVLDYSIETTSKGNGSIRIGEQIIRTLDSHDDGLVFEGGVLDHHFVDVDLDGDLDLIVSGVAVVTEGEGRVPGKKPVIAIFIYDKLTKKLKQTVTSSCIYVTRE